MRESLYKSYSLRGTELALLLTAENEKAVHSFGFIDGSETKEAYLYAVDHMIKQGIASSDGERLTVCEPYKEMVRCIKNASSVISVRSFDDELNDYCIYHDGSDRLLVLSMSSVRKNSVLLTHMTPDELFESFLPDELFPSELSDCDDPEELDVCVFPLMLDQLLNKRDISDVRFIVGIDELDTENSKHRSIIAMNLPGGIYTVRYDGTGTTAEIYDREGFKSELSRMVRGEERL